MVKVANVRLPGAEVVQQAHQTLQRLYSSFEGSGVLLAGSIPSPMGVVRVGSLLASMERSARVPQFVDLILDRQYFDSRDRVLREAETGSAQKDMTCDQVGQSVEVLLEMLRLAFRPLVLADVLIHPGGGFALLSRGRSS